MEIRTEANNMANKGLLIDTEPGLKEYYESSAEISDYSGLTGRNLRKETRRTEYFINRLNLLAGQSLLDVGCGDGLQLEAFRKSNPYLDLYGIDISEKRIQRSAKRVNAKLQAGSAYQLPYENEKFDAIICSEVLEHVPSPELVIGQIARVMKTGAKAAISVPYRQQITYDICAHCGKRTPTSGHINSFDEDAMSAMLKNAGLDPLNACGAVGSASLIAAFDIFPFRAWEQIDRLVRKIRRDEIFLIAIAQKN